MAAGASGKARLRSSCSSLRLQSLYREFCKERVIAHRSGLVGCGDEISVLGGEGLLVVGCVAEERIASFVALRGCLGFCFFVLGRILRPVPAFGGTDCLADVPVARGL